MTADWITDSDPYLVAQPPDRRDAWTEQAAAAGHQGTQQLLGVGIQSAPDQVAEGLGISQSAPVVVRRRLILLDGRPVELADSYYPASIAADTALAENGKIKGGAISLLARMGFTAAKSLNDVAARLPNDEEQQALDLRYDEPVLVLTRVTVTADGTPFECAVMTMPATGRHIRYETRSA